MIVREYTEADFSRIKELHGQSGFDYKMPTLSSDAFFSRRVVEGDDTIGMAACLRLTAEAFLFCDPRWRTPSWRFDALKQLCRICNDDAKQIGVQDVVAFLPPDIDGKFGKRLTQLGWDRARDKWTSYSKAVI